MAQTQIARKENGNHLPVGKNNMLFRTHSLKVFKGGRRRVVEVDLDIPLEKILKEVNFDSSLLDPGIVGEILGNALAESRAGKIPRKWSFEFVGITMNDKYSKELKLIREISEDISNGSSGVVDEVQSLESFLDPQSLSSVLSNALSNKKLQVLTPLEIIFFAYARKASGIKAFMPYFPVERIIRYQKPNSPSLDVLNGMVPQITFPLFFGKVKVKGHLLSGAELNVRRESNSYFVYKVYSPLVNMDLCQN